MLPLTITHDGQCKKDHVLNGREVEPLREIDIYRNDIDHYPDMPILEDLAHQEPLCGHTQHPDRRIQKGHRIVRKSLENESHAKDSPEAGRTYHCLLCVIQEGYRNIRGVLLRMLPVVPTVEALSKENDLECGIRVEMSLSEHHKEGQNAHDPRRP